MPVSIQIQRMQTERWRFLGFVSAVVGLLCYALSSSFNHLFGHWNFFKIFLYFIFSFVICFITLFANHLQRSTSTLFKTRMAVLVLSATTLYSFFYDKEVNQKPDAYILMSCVAFAVMSLSLSKQTHFGFEGDLLNYFLGCLIIQLMKIHFWLFFVGAGFSYSLHIFFHSSSDVTLQSGLSEDHIVIQVVHHQEASTNGAIQVDSQHVNTDSATQVASQHVNTDSAIQVDSLELDGFMPQLIACITALKDTDRVILHQHRTFLEESLHDSQDFIDLPIDDNLVIDSLPRETIDNLQETIRLMAAAGFEKECCDVYISCRRKFLRQCFLNFHLSDLNSQESLKLAIHRWKIASYLALRKLFPCERRLCERFFSGFSSAADLSFVEVCRELAIDLLKFTDKMAIQRRSLSHLSSNLKVFQTLTDLIPEFKSLFHGDCSASLINEAITIWDRLGEAIRLTFDLENDISGDMELNSVPDIGIDPVTRLVESCFEVVYRGRNILEQILRGKNTPDQFSKEYSMAVVGDREGTFPSLSICMSRILVLLHSNLEAKSKNHTSPALAYVFMINNYDYIVQRLEFNRLRAILGMDRIIKRTAKYQHKLEWNRVLDILKLDSNESEESMKEKLKLFNMQFKEMRNFQFVLDRKLRQRISRSIEKNLLPAYGNFIGRFQNLIGKQAYEYIEYSMFDIDALVKNLLRGSEEVPVGN